MESSKGHKLDQSHLDHFFISKDQDVVFVFVCDPSFNMVKPTATNHYKPNTTLVSNFVAVSRGRGDIICIYVFDN